MEEKEDGIPQKDGANFPAIEKPQKKQKRQHLRWFGHGKVWTFAALVSGWVGVIFSVLSYRSVEFVHLQEPIRVGALYEPVSSTGMIRMELCFNETVSEYSGCDVLTVGRHGRHYVSTGSPLPCPGDSFWWLLYDCTHKFCLLGVDQPSSHRIWLPRLVLSTVLFHAFLRYETLQHQQVQCWGRMRLLHYSMFRVDCCMYRNSQDGRF